MIATPGRLEFLLQKQNFILRSGLKALVKHTIEFFIIYDIVTFPKFIIIFFVQEVLVLDEADRLLELGFKTR